MSDELERAILTVQGTGPINEAACNKATALANVSIAQSLDNIDISLREICDLLRQRA